MNRRNFITKAIVGIAAVPLLGKLVQGKSRQYPDMSELFQQMEARKKKGSETICIQCADAYFQRRLIAKAKKGDVVAVREILDTVYGKQPQRNPLYGHNTTARTPTVVAFRDFWPKS